MPLATARLLPGGGTWYERTERNEFGHVARLVTTYTTLGGSRGTRTNVFVYATNNLDLVQQVSPENRQVLSNYFSTLAYHQPAISYDALEQPTVFAYNSLRQLTSVTRPGGLTTLYDYGTTGSGSNRLEKTTDLQIQRTNTYTWYSNGLLETHTNERGLTTTNHWDNLQRLIGTGDPAGTTTNVCSVLDIVASKDRLGNWSYFGYNGVRQQVAATNAMGVVTRFGYCDCGGLTSITNAFGTADQLVTSRVFDYQGNLLSVTTGDTVVTNGYNALRQLAVTHDGRGLRFNWYNNQGLVYAVTTPESTEQSTVYDLEDRSWYVTDANGVTVTNTYDGLNRLLSRGYPDGGVESFGYATNGLVAYTNQLGHYSRFVNDAAGRRAWETNANLEWLEYYYDSSGNLTNLVDGKRQSTWWNYDQFGRVTNKLDQAGIEILRYTYNANDLLLSRWSRSKGTTSYSYDLVGNLTNINYPNSTDIRFTYDALNRLKTMVDAVGTTAYAYNNGGQPWMEDGPWDSDIVTNTYVNGLRTALALQQPTGAWTNGFAYDYAGRLTNVTSQAGSHGYQLGGTASGSPLVKRLLLPGGSVITNAYDIVGRLLDTALTNSAGTVLNRHEYVYNAAGQREQQIRTDESEVDYNYDPIGQLTYAHSTVATEDRDYVYDTAWNLSWRTNSGVAQRFIVDDKNQLTNAVTRTMVYDDNGNLISASNTCNLLEYDDENQLVRWFHFQNGSSQRVSGDKRTDFVYDGRNRLRKRIEYTWVVIAEPPIEDLRGGEGIESEPSPTDSTNWIAELEVRYIYDANRVIQERNSNNIPTVSYTRGMDLSGSLEGAGGIGGLLSRSHGYSSGNWTQHSYYQADANGNITYIANSSGGLAATYRYDSFGNLISKSGPVADANVYRFSSKELHVNSGLYYYLYRFYSPNWQRWVNRDPLEEEGGYDLYTFALNAPLAYIDPFGNDLIRIPLDRFDPNDNRDRSRQFNRGCIGLCSWYQSEGCGKPKEFPEDASNTKCFSSKSQAEGYKCPANKTAFIFAKQGNWKNGKPPKPKRDGRVPNDSIGHNGGHYNYVACLGGNYYWMDHGFDTSLPMPNVYIDNKPPNPGGSYPNEIWCVTCKCKGK